MKEKLMKLLDEYDYSYSEFALDCIINEWNSQKESLRRIFRNHPNWVEEENMIVFDMDMNREIDINAISEFREWARNQFYIRNNNSWIGDFWYEHNIPKQQFVDDEVLETIKRYYPDIRVSKGMKTSRAMNKICAHHGLDKYPDFNKEFAKFADALNPLKITRHTIISINLLDYLTMSFGNSWASCHTIDKQNKRRMPNDYSGCYSSGTLSYALDKTSIVFYTVDAKYDGNEYYFEPKINRQMFHFGEDKLVQGRLYPQSCDRGSMDEYTQFRNIMQEIFADCLKIPNLWTLQRGTDACRNSIVSYGTHYRDYYSFDNCTVSTIKGSENRNYMEVGAEPICIECGCRHYNEDNINCCSSYCHCENCGCEIDEDDAIEINGELYCRDCVTYCDYCEEYHLEDEVRWVDSYNGYVCDNCLDDDFEYCEHCGEYYLREDMIFIECEDMYVCNDCLGNYGYCDNCHEYYPIEQINEYNGHCYCEDCLEEIKEYEEEDEDEEEAI